MANAQYIDNVGLIAFAGSRGSMPITREQIEARIETVEYVAARDKLTLCSVTLDNGFIVSGEASCIDPAEFNSSVSQRMAYEDAVDKLWTYLGFMAREDAHRDQLDRRRALQVQQVM